MVRVLVLLFVVLISFASSQTVISVDENLSRNKEKSLALSLALAAAIPGAGHYYLAEKKSAKTFFWIETALWISAGSLYFYSDNELKNARGYAVKYANAAGAPKDVDFLNLMGEYRSRGGVAYQNSSPDNNEDYNQSMIRAGREIDEEYPYEYGYIWDWGASDNPENTKHIDNYNKMLRRYRISKIAFQVSLGAMALNRVLSVLDVLRIYRKTSANFSQMQITPLATPAYSGIFVNYEF